MMVTSSPSISTTSDDALLTLAAKVAADLAIVAMDAHGRVQTLNVGAERLLGYSEEELKGRNADVIFTPEDLAIGASICAH